MEIKKKGINSYKESTGKLRENLTIDGYINKHGGIQSNVDGKVYTTKNAYMDHLKRNNCHIKDY